MTHLEKGDYVVLEDGRIADVLTVYDDDLVSVRFDDGTCDVVLRRYLQLHKGLSHLEGRN